MRRSICALLLAITLPMTALADEVASAAPKAEAETPQQKRARLEAERDAARMKFLNFGLPQYSLEAEAKQKAIDELDAKLAKEAAGP
ncbi:MAG TPA: hypothetical protein VGD74_10745 [Vulgatibacter sp.]